MSDSNFYERGLLLRREFKEKRNTLPTLLILGAGILYLRQGFPSLFNAAGFSELRRFNKLLGCLSLATLTLLTFRITNISAIKLLKQIELEKSINAAQLNENLGNNHH